MINKTKAHMDVAISDRARKIIEDTIGENEHLRLGARSGGCSGWKWVLESEEKTMKEPNDDTYFTKNFDIVVNHSILHEVIGSCQIDYKETGNLVEDGFIVRRTVNPGHECGCGESFTPIAEIHGNKVTIDNV